MTHPSLRCPRCDRLTMRLIIENALSRLQEVLMMKQFMSVVHGTDEGLQDYFEKGYSSK